MKRQMVFIMTDSQRFDMVNCYKETGLKTPCIDALAAQGVRYERAYTVQPVCGPARSALFTGLYPANNWSWCNGMPLGENVKTIGQRLNDNGIHCAYIGKWHLDGTDYYGNGRCPEGWDDEYWYDMRRYLEEMSIVDRIKSRRVETMNFEKVPENFTYGSRVAAKAIDFVEKHKDEDYFLVVSFDEPHGPCLCPPPYDEMYKDYEFPKNPAVWDTLEGKPEYQKVWASENPLPARDKLKIKNPYYFGCNSYVDSLIGKVIEAIPEDSAIVYTSDHGDFLNSHSLFAKGPAAYDDVARIPLIMRLPGGAKGVYDKGPVSHISMCPTILEYYGLPISKALHGESILQTSKDLTADAPEYAFIEFSRFEIDHDHWGGFQPVRAVTDKRWKLSINLLGGDEFYDLKNDPYEMHNLIDSIDPAVIAERDRLHDALLDRMCRDRDPFRGYYWDCRPWRKDAKAPDWRYRGYIIRQRENEEYEPRQIDYMNGLEMNNAQRYRFNSWEVHFTSLEQMIEHMRMYDNEERIAPEYKR